MFIWKCKRQSNFNGPCTIYLTIVANTVCHSIFSKCSFIVFDFRFAIVCKRIVDRHFLPVLSKLLSLVLNWSPSILCMCCLCTFEWMQYLCMNRTIDGEVKEGHVKWFKWMEICCLLFVLLTHIRKPSTIRQKKNSYNKHNEIVAYTDSATHGTYVHCLRLKLV